MRPRQEDVSGAGNQVDQYMVRPLPRCRLLLLQDVFEARILPLAVWHARTFVFQLHPAIRGST